MGGDHKKKVILNTRVQNTSNEVLMSPSKTNDDDKTFNFNYSNTCSKLEISGSDGSIYHWKHSLKWLMGNNERRIVKAKSKHLTLHTETYILDQMKNVVAICRTKDIFSFTHTPFIWILKEPKKLEDIDIKEITKNPHDITVKGDFCKKRCIWYDSEGNIITKFNRDKSTCKSFYCVMGGNLNSELILSVFIGLQKILKDQRAINQTVVVNAGVTAIM